MYRENKNTHTNTFRNVRDKRIRHLFKVYPFVLNSRLKFRMNYKKIVSQITSNTFWQMPILYIPEYNICANDHSLTHGNTNENKTSNQPMDGRLGEHLAREPHPLATWVVQARVAGGHPRVDVLVQPAHDDDGRGCVQHVVA